MHKTSKVHGPVTIEADQHGAVKITKAGGGLLGVVKNGPRLGQVLYHAHITGSWSGRPIVQELKCWRDFAASMHGHHGLVVPKSFKPAWCE